MLNTLTNKGESMKNTMKKKIANYIKKSLPEYDSKDCLNVKLIKGNPITLKQYINILSQLKSRWAYNSIKDDHRKLDTESYANVFARNCIERNICSEYSSGYKRNSEDTLQYILYLINPELHQEIVDIKVNKHCQNHIDHEKAINELQGRA
tara:strand:- start:274 stop:726 length:453 start_codon:yes stop_codon:yes gene_type:complete